jgi:hypothetical protein
MHLKRRTADGRIRRVRARTIPPLTQAQVQAHVRRLFPAPAAAAPASQSSAEPYTDSQRTSRRIRVTGEISVRKAGCFNFQVPALDISTHGCRIEFVEAVDAGERVIVRLPALEPLGADVAWVCGMQAGLRFDRPLHPAVFDQLLGRFSACAA